MSYLGGGISDYEEKPYKHICWSSFLRWEECLKHILESLIITNTSVPQAGTFIEDLRSLIANRSSVSYINLTSAIDCWVDPCV